MGPFLSKMVYKRVRDWTSGRNLPYKTLVRFPPPTTSDDLIKIAAQKARGDSAYDRGGDASPPPGLKDHRLLQELVIVSFYC